MDATSPPQQPGVVLLTVMPDHRTRRQKLEAVIHPNSGATEGERSNARSLLAKMKPEAPRASPPGWFDAWEKARTYEPPSASFHIHNYLRTDYFDKARRRCSCGLDEPPEVWQNRLKVQDDIRRASEELRRRSFDDIRNIFESLHTNRWGPPPGHRYDAPSPPGEPPDPAFCVKNGHDYVVIGYDMYQHELRRCSICLEFDPPRPKKKGATSGP